MRNGGVGYAESGLGAGAHAATARSADNLRKVEAGCLRVGIIAACPFPADHGTPGGIREKAEALAELGHEVHVITYASHQPGHVRGVRIHRIAPVGPVHDIKVGPSKAKIFWDLQLVWKTIQVVRREKLDVIHGINYEGAMVGCLAKWVTGVPLVYGAVNTMADELHTYKFIWPPKLARVLARILDWTVPRLADRAVCYTQAIHDFLVSTGVPADRVDIIKLGIDLSMFKDATPGDARRRLNVNGAPLIVYTGVLNKFQRIDYLLQAMRVVRRDLPDAKLAFVRTLDDEPQRQEVEQMAEEEGVRDAVLFPEVISFGELPPYLAAADVTAIPRPDCPGVPVKLLNFMAAGRPIVVTRGSSQGLRDRHEVLVVEDHNPEAMGQALVHVLRDKDLAKRLGRNARAAAYAHYDRLATTVDLVVAYRKAMAAKDRVPQSAAVVMAQV
ncbi:MAG: glycosyltransferase family 4 protein [Planctomycetota bacterium]